MNRCVILLGLLLIAQQAIAENVEREPFFRPYPQLQWEKMNPVEKIMSAVLIPPGYVIGIFTRGVAWICGK